MSAAIPPERYTHPMPITLDPATEARIQRELARGIYATPDELITRAIDRIAADED